uniref:Polyphenol oxidase n=1 Tax=Taraxacum officinale TaxID=50225 RepID=U3UB86_TAROF|nr:polyphenol oxidase precursor [Taraxacum officinale]
MASLQLLTTFTTTATPRKPPNPTSSRRSKTYPKQTHRFKVSCNVAKDDNENLLLVPESQKLILNVDRRNLLLGLGGAGLYTSLPAAFAAPITTPDISTCIPSESGFNTEDSVRSNQCCPPATSSTIPKEFVFPKDTTTRIRPAAHRATPEYVAKYKAAIQAMRDLPDDHPHSFVSQAKIHCAYCNGGYTQVASGFPDKMLQVHNSWLFFPFHRWYLYFYERILGKLIDDPTFALPYWNWDHPAGMTLPAFFETDGKRNPVFDAYRNVTHVTPAAIVDLDYNGSDSGAPCLQQINTNLTAMYKQMVSNAADPLSFFGGVYKAGDDPFGNGDPSVGSVEAGCHTAVHRWVGNPRMMNTEDMGNFYSAGYDPAFYVHHANVDRMWKVWKDLGIPGHSEPTDPDWLNASFVFYDENEQLVRVYNKDCVNLENLKYDYELSPLPWLKNRPVPHTPKPVDNAAKPAIKLPEVKFPVKLDKTVKVYVKRPVKKRGKAEKDKVSEQLVLKGIKFNSTKFVKVDVFVNDQDDAPAILPSESEFVGSFAQLPHGRSGRGRGRGHGHSELMTSAARFGLTELLEDIGAEDDEYILVTLVPKAGSEDVTVEEITVELVPVNP